MTHVFPVCVFYEDTDMAGVVYHANYLRYIERARSDLVRELGNDQNAMLQDGIVWVVRRIECDYLATAQFDDQLEVRTEVVSVSGARAVMDQKVCRGEKLIFTSIVTVVCMNSAGRPVRLPAEIRATMR